jgi:hypothetical protein
MIANSTELRVAVRQLRIMEMALAALREQLQSANPRLLDVTSPAYVRRIGALQDEIAQYFAGHPDAVSLVLPRLDQMEELSTASVMI